LLNLVTISRKLSPFFVLAKKLFSYSRRERFETPLSQMLNRTPARAIIRLDPNSISSGYAHPVEFKIFDDEYDIHDLGTQSLIDQNEALYLFHIFVLVVEVRDIAKFQTAM